MRLDMMQQWETFRVLLKRQKDANKATVMRLTSNHSHIHFPAQHSCHLSSSPQLPGLTNKDVMSLPAP